MAMVAEGIGVPTESKTWGFSTEKPLGETVTPEGTTQFTIMKLPVPKLFRVTLANVIWEELKSAIKRLPMAPPIEVTEPDASVPERTAGTTPDGRLMVSIAPPARVFAGRLGMLRVRVALAGPVMEPFTATETALEVVELFAASYALAVRL